MPEWVSHSAEETIKIGRKIAEKMKPPVLILLSGDLGAGKTTLSKGIISGLGAAREEDVTSPTFTLVHVFKYSGVDHSMSGAGTPACAQAESRNICNPLELKVYHVDLYRIEHFADLESLGLEDVLSENAVLLIEWPDRFSLRTDWPRIEIALEHLDTDSRRIRLSEVSIGGNLLDAKR